jgi:nucleoside-triphosphatase THEP1
MRSNCVLVRSSRSMLMCNDITVMDEVGKIELIHCSVAKLFAC